MNHRHDRQREVLVGVHGDPERSISAKDEVDALPRGLAVSEEAEIHRGEVPSIDRVTEWTGIVKVAR